MLVVPVYNTLLIPDTTVYCQKEQLRRNTGDKGITLDQKVILIVAKNNIKAGEMKEEDFYPIGISGVITHLDSQGYVAIRTRHRVHLDSVGINEDHSIDLTLSRRNDIEDLDETVAQTKLDSMIKEMRAFSSGFQWADMAEQYFSQIDSVSSTAAMLSPWLKITNEECYEILAEDSVAKRTEMLEKILYDFL